MSRVVKISEGQLQGEDGVQLPSSALDSEAYLGATATDLDTAGTIVGSVEVVAADGTSLGFLALYDEITAA